MTILIADDDPVEVQALKARLKQAGYRVVAVFDAMQAIMTALRNPPDAVLLDMNMPGGGGPQVIRQLRNSIRTSRVPILLITGQTDGQATATAMGLGADALLAPADFQRLEAILEARLAPTPG